MPREEKSWDAKQNVDFIKHDDRIIIIIIIIFTDSEHLEILFTKDYTFNKRGSQRLFPVSCFLVTSQLSLDDSPSCFFCQGTFYTVDYIYLNLTFWERKNRKHTRHDTIFPSRYLYYGGELVVSLSQMPSRGFQCSLVWHDIIRHNAIMVWYKCNSVAINVYWMNGNNHNEIWVIQVTPNFSRLCFPCAHFIS